MAPATPSRYRHTIDSHTWSFRDLKDLMAKATPLRSGDVLAGVVERGTEVVLVTSGSISAGFMPLGLERRPDDVATAQAAAAVGQSSLMATYTDAFGAYDITTAARAAEEELLLGRVLCRTQEELLYSL